MKNSILIFMVAFCISCLFACDHKYVSTEWEEDKVPNWQNPDVDQENREDAKAYYIPFATVDEINREDKWASSRI